MNGLHVPACQRPQVQPINAITTATTIHQPARGLSQQEKAADDACYEPSIMTQSFVSGQMQLHRSLRMLTQTHCIQCLWRLCHTSNIDPSAHVPPCRTSCASRALQCACPQGLWCSTDLCSGTTIRNAWTSGHGTLPFKSGAAHAGGQGLLLAVMAEPTANNSRQLQLVPEVRSPATDCWL